jgi:hypothetical protein
MLTKVGMDILRRTCTCPVVLILVLMMPMPVVVAALGTLVL